MASPVALPEVKRSPAVRTLIGAANDALGALGYTEHGFRHAGLVASVAKNILLRLHYPERRAELAAIAGYLHDIGNVINRDDHGHSGALLAWDILGDLGMAVDERAIILTAIGNHEDLNEPLNDVAAAVILADKSDVHRTRVRNPDLASFDNHDRVNYAATYSFLRVDDLKGTITLELTIDNTISSIMDYFEIFLTRMALSRRCAHYLGCAFELVINRMVLASNAPSGGIRLIEPLQQAS